MHVELRLILYFISNIYILAGCVIEQLKYISEGYTKSVICH